MVPFTTLVTFAGKLGSVMEVVGGAGTSFSLTGTAAPWLAADASLAAGLVSCPSEQHGGAGASTFLALRRPVRGPWSGPWSVVTDSRRPPSGRTAVGPALCRRAGG